MKSPDFTRLILRRDIERKRNESSFYVWKGTWQMIVRVCTFTKQGEMLAREIFDDWEEMIPKFRTTDVSLEEWTGECFQKRLPILFVGACGIAVRSIAPFVKDKLADSPV